MPSSTEGRQRYSLSALTLGARGVWVVSTKALPLYDLEREPVPILPQTGWASASVWMSPENLAPTGIRHLDRADRNGSIYRLRYPGDSIRTVR
jgi:hypothetical protein